MLGGEFAVLQAPLFDLPCRLRPSSEHLATKNNGKNHINYLKNSHNVSNFVHLKNAQNVHTTHKLVISY